MDKLNILVIDDKKVIGDLFDFTLGYSGHSITIIDNPTLAIEVLQKKSFDIAFVDIVMPEKDGVAMLKDIKQILPGLPVVMMSGFSVEDKRKKCQELGAVACLKKPFEIEDVKKVIKAALGKEI